MGCRIVGLYVLNKNNASATFTHPIVVTEQFSHSGNAPRLLACGFVLTTPPPPHPVPFVYRPFPRPPSLRVMTTIPPSPSGNNCTIKSPLQLEQDPLHFL